MAIGFTPKHIQNLSQNDLTQKQFLVLLNETAVNMGWKVGYISDNGLIAYTDNGMFSRNAEIKIKIESGVANIQSASTSSEMLDFGMNKKNVTEFIQAFEEIKAGLTNEELDVKYLELQKTLVSQEEDILKLPPATTTENIRDIISVFVPKKEFLITPLLLDINILIFALMAISGVNILLPDTQSLLSWGANFRPLTLDGEWWRLITNCFLHIGIFHLLMNMYALLYIGVLLEPLLGKIRFLSAYLLTGITASVASLWWHGLTVSAGASGAIFGMYGVFLAMLTTNLIEKTARKALLTSIAVFVGYNLLFGLKGGIDNAAHIGGLLGGIIIGYAFFPSLKKPQENKLKFTTIGFVTILIAVSSLFVYKSIPNDFGAYDAKMKEFTTLEAMALEVYKMPENTPKDKILYEIKERGIYFWNENLKLIDSLDELDLPDEITDRNRLLTEYCELRIKSFELLYKMISEDTDLYKEQIDQNNMQIETIIKEIGGGR